MKVIRPKVLVPFRTPGPCEFCGKWCQVREPAHIFASGMGGARLDVSINLVALGSTPRFACPCHREHHQGRTPLKCDLMRLTAKREKTTHNAVERVLTWLRNLPKGSSDERARRGICLMPLDTAELAERIWAEVCGESLVKGR